MVHKQCYFCAKHAKEHGRPLYCAQIDALLLTVVPWLHGKVNPGCKDSKWWCSDCRDCYNAWNTSQKQVEVESGRAGTQQLMDGGRDAEMDLGLGDHENDYQEEAQIKAGMDVDEVGSGEIGGSEETQLHSSSAGESHRPSSEGGSDFEARSYVGDQQQEGDGENMTEVGEAQVVAVAKKTKRNDQLSPAEMLMKLGLLGNKVRKQGKAINKFKNKATVGFPGRLSQPGMRSRGRDRKILDSVHKADRLMSAQGFDRCSISNLVIAIADGLLSPDSVNLHYIAGVGQNTQAKTMAGTRHSPKIKDLLAGAICLNGASACVEWLTGDDGPATDSSYGR